MTTYRTDDVNKWGAGKGSDLTPTEVDTNFYDAIQRIITLEARPIASGGIDYFEISGDQLYVHLIDDTTILGPYTLPKATFRSRGDWSALTAYAALDTFTQNGGLYLVNLPHTSAATFDAGANDGLGHDYYTLMIQTPGNVLPTGGATGQVLTKSAATDYSVTWGWKTPTGGTARQMIVKQSATQDDAAWETPQADDIGFTPVSGSTLTSTTVADALEEVSGGGGSAVNIVFTPTTASGLTSTNVEDAINEVAAGSGAGRQTMWIPASAMSPLITNGPAPGLIETTTYKNLIKTLDFDPTTSESAQFEVAMPKSWDNGQLGFMAYSSRSSTTTNFGVAWKLEVVSILRGSTIDSNPQSPTTVTDTLLNQDGVYVTDESAGMDVLVTDGSATFGINRYLVFRISRDPANASDTLAIDARLHGVLLLYTTNAGTDD